MGQTSFIKKEHLKSSKSIKNVFDKGIPSRGRLIKVFLLKKETDSHINRVAFIVRKNLCNKKAVLRNRFRRLLREAYRKTKHILPTGYDIVLLATNINKNTKSTVLEREIADAFKKCIKK